MSSEIDTINDIIRDLESLALNFEEAPEKGDIIDILEALEQIDIYYDLWCTDIDIYNDKPVGTTYKSNNGISLEFCIEADTWHYISKLLRKLK
jgi:hypothetical protein